MLDELQELVNRLARRLGRAVSLTTPQLVSIVFSPHDADDIDEVRRSSLLSRDTEQWVVDWFHSYGVGTATTPVLVRPHPTQPSFARWVVPITSRDVRLGLLCVLDRSMTCTDATFADASELIAAIADTMAEDHERLTARGRAVRALLAGEADERAAAARTLHDVLAPHRALRVVALTSLSGTIAARRSTRRGPRPVAEGEWVDHHAMIVAEPTPPAPPCCPEPIAGLGDPVSEPTMLHRSYEQARHALRAVACLPELRPIAHWDDLGAIRLLSGRSVEQLRELIDPRIQHVVESDDDVVTTVATYLDCAGHAGRTAERLTVHRGTLYYRLRKFSEITGIDLDDGQGRLAVHIGLYAARLATDVSYRSGGHVPAAPGML